MPAKAVPQPQKVSKKLQQFIDEVNDTFDTWREKYQYKLITVLRYTSKGIVPGWSVEEVIPEKKIKKRIKKNN